MGNIADNPEQWSSGQDDPFDTVARQQAYAPAAPMARQGHGRSDYHVLRAALADIMDSTSSARLRQIARDALDATPRDGSSR